MSGILYRLRTGCQWDAIPSEFGSGSTCYRRFVEWTEAGVFRMAHVEALLFYDDERGIAWDWASLGSASVKVPKGETSPVRIRRIALVMNGFLMWKDLPKNFSASIKVYNITGTTWYEPSQTEITDPINKIPHEGAEATLRLTYAY